VIEGSLILLTDFHGVDVGIVHAVELNRGFDHTRNFSHTAIFGFEQLKLENVSQKVGQFVNLVKA